MAQFSQEIQQQRYDKGNIYLELELLKELPQQFSTQHHKTPFGLSITVEVSNIPLKVQDIQFQLQLHGKYPLQPPRLLKQTIISYPSLADGRDLLEDCLSEPWNARITCKDIIEKLPEFILQCEQLKQQQLQQSIGKFHLSYPMFLDTWLRKNGMGVFNCVEVDQNNKRFKRQRILVITHTMILQLDINQQFPGIGYLISWGTLQALNMIKRSKSDPNLITFVWKQIGNSPAFSQQFEIEESCIDLIQRNMQNLGAKVNRHTTQATLKEEEVSANSISSVNIEDTLKIINNLEENLSEDTISQNKVNRLMSLYQKVIEYYSAINDPMFEEYLMKMHRFLNSPAVLSALKADNVVNTKANEKLFIDRVEDDFLQQEFKSQDSTEKSEDHLQEVQELKQNREEEEKNSVYLAQQEVQQESCKDKLLKVEEKQQTEVSAEIQDNAEEEELQQVNSDEMQEDESKDADQINESKEEEKQAEENEDQRQEENQVEEKLEVEKLEKQVEEKQEDENKEEVKQVEDKEEIQSIEEQQTGEQQIEKIVDKEIEQQEEESSSIENDESPNTQ